LGVYGFGILGEVGSAVGPGGSGEMRTKTVMVASAVVMMVLGLGTTFAPQELLGAWGVAPLPVTVLVVQVAGALYFGFAIMNWMAKDVLIGGIYSRPLALGNFAHFFVMAGALVKALIAGHHEAPVWAGAVVYVVFAWLFGQVVFGDPLGTKGLGARD